MQAFDIITQFSKMLGNLDSWIGEAVETATARKFDPEVLVNARLAPDMYTFVEQVQSASDAAKYAAAYLTETTAPTHPDTETTIAEIRQRIATCREYLGSLKPEQFANAANVQVKPPWLGGKWIPGEAYLLQVAFQNFSFHVTVAYSILRHNGVALGKQKLIGSIPIMG